MKSTKPIWKLAILVISLAFYLWIIPILGNAQIQTPGEVERVITDTSELKLGTFKSWTIKLTATHFTLICFENSKDSNGKSIYKRTELMPTYRLGQETQIDKAFEKFLEWVRIAESNKAAPFEKVMLSIPDLDNRGNYHNFIFVWDENKFSPEDRARLRASTINLGIYKRDAVKLRQLLAQIPALKQELAEQLRKKGSQDKLFK